MDRIEIRTIAEWSYHTVDMLCQFDNALAAQQPIRDWYDGWQQTRGFQTYTTFRPMNQGVTLMLAYVLLDLSVELLDQLSPGNGSIIDGFDVKNFDCFCREVFQNPKKLPEANYLLKGLRDAIAHSRIDIDIESNTYEFRDRAPNSNQDHFCVKVNHPAFMQFLNEWGKHLINDVLGTAASNSEQRS